MAGRQRAKQARAAQTVRRPPQLGLILLSLIPLTGCGPIQVNPRYFGSSAGAAAEGRGAVRLEVIDRRSGGVVLGVTRDIYKQPIDADKAPQQIVSQAFQEALSRAGYSITDDSKTVLRIELTDFSVTWAQEFGATVTASVSTEALISFDGAVIASRQISQSASADKKSYTDGSEEGSRALSEALTNVVNMILADPSFREAMAEEDNAKRAHADEKAREHQQDELNAKVEAEKARLRAESELARVRSEVAATEQRRLEASRTAAQATPAPVAPREPKASGGRSLRERVSGGTCFVVSSEGLIVTALHVVAGAREIEVQMGSGQSLKAKVETRNSPLDIALLRVGAATPNYLVLAPPRSVEIGDDVFTIGFPITDVLGEEAKFTAGAISALSGIKDEPAYFQISVPVQPGNSGGPLMNNRGQVVGMIVGTAAALPFIQATGVVPQNINWAIKSDYIAPMFDAPSSTGGMALDRHHAIEVTQRALCKVRATK